MVQPAVEATAAEATAAATAATEHAASRGKPHKGLAGGWTSNGISLSCSISIKYSVSGVRDRSDKEKLLLRVFALRG